ncbi:MAG: TlpA family protein disulfide reductase [Micrococcales bacterium]
MPQDIRLYVLLAVVLVAVLGGVFYRLTTGKAKQVAGGIRVDLKELNAIKDGQVFEAFDRKITFLQFSSQYCTQCPGTARLLGELEVADPSVRHIEVDITERLDLAKKYNVLQTPTTLVLDRKGFVKSRIGGAPKQQTLEAEIGTFEI